MSRSVTSLGRADAARKGWETRKANEARLARRFDEVVAENWKLKEAIRALLRELENQRAYGGPSDAEQAAADLVRT